jgi:hypothetical protein
MLDEIKVSGLVDFSVENVYAVVCWLLNHANEYMVEQMLEVFDEMHTLANIKRYKSNERVFEEDMWRYNQDKPTHVALEYRIVMHNIGGVNKGDEIHWDRGLQRRACDFLRDLMTVANNLGFLCDNTDHRLMSGRSNWQSGKSYVFRWLDSDGSSKELLEVKGFYNGNVHIRLGQDFARALNVEVGRLRGWIKSPQEAAEELGDPQAAAIFGRQIMLGVSSVKLLGMGGDSHDRADSE